MKHASCFTIAMILLVSLTQRASAKDLKAEQKNLLAGTYWTLKKMETYVLPKNAITTLNFKDDTNVNGGSCNHYSSTYKIKGPAFEFNSIRQTAKSCGKIRNQFEEDYFYMLAEVEKWQIDANELILTVRDTGLRLWFSRAEK